MTEGKGPNMDEASKQDVHHSQDTRILIDARLKSSYKIWLIFQLFVLIAARAYFPARYSSPFVSFGEAVIRT